MATLRARAKSEKCLGIQPRARDFHASPAAAAVSIQTPVDHNRMAENPIRIAGMAKDREDSTIIVSGTYQVQH